MLLALWDALSMRAVAMIIDGNENQYTPKEIYTQVSNYLTSSI